MCRHSLWDVSKIHPNLLAESLELQSTCARPVAVVPQENNSLWRQNPWIAGARESPAAQSNILDVKVVSDLLWTLFWDLTRLIWGISREGNPKNTKAGLSSWGKGSKMFLWQRLQDMNYALPKTDFSLDGRREISVHPNPSTTGTSCSAGNYIHPVQTLSIWESHSLLFCLSIILCWLWESEAENHK